MVSDSVIGGLLPRWIKVLRKELGPFVTVLRQQPRGEIRM